MSDANVWHGTTIVYVRRGNDVVIAGDGQVTLGHQIIKCTATKIRTLADDTVLAGFAGSTADALSLFERLKQKLQQHENNLEKSVVELSKDWRTDQVLRKLEAMMIVADVKNAFILTGSGDVLKPETEEHGEIATIGSGGGYAIAAGRAMLAYTKLDAETIAYKSLGIAAQSCVFTNDHITSVSLTVKEDK